MKLIRIIHTGMIMSLMRVNGFEWAARMDGSTSDISNSVATDPDGNVIVAGRYTSSPLWIYQAGGGANVSSLINAGSWGGFVVKLSSSGTFLWAARIDGSDFDNCLSVATDANSSVIVTGEYSSSPLLIYQAYGGASVDSFPNDGFWGGFVVKYSSSGVFQWSARLDGTNTEGGGAVATDASGNVVVTGQYYSSPLFISSSASINLKP
jgi:hypothetical protein